MGGDYDKPFCTQFVYDKLGETAVFKVRRIKCSPKDDSFHRIIISKYRKNSIVAIKLVKHFHIKL